MQTAQGHSRPAAAVGSEKLSESALKTDDVVGPVKNTSAVLQCPPPLPNPRTYPQPPVGSTAHPALRGYPRLQQYSCTTCQVCLTWACEHVVEVEAAACARLGSERVAPGTTKLFTLFTQSIAVTTTTIAGRKHRPLRSLVILPAASLLRFVLCASMLAACGAAAKMNALEYPETH